MKSSGFALLFLLLGISRAGDDVIEADADCSDAYLYSGKCDKCEGAPFDSGLNSVITCKGQSKNGQIKKGVCFPKEDHYVCKAACMYEDEGVCDNMVPDTKKPPAFLGVGDSCCRGKRPICCGRKDGRNYKGAICKEDQTLKQVMELTGAKDANEIQACCHRGARDPWPGDSRHHIIWNKTFYECEMGKDGNLKKLKPSKGEEAEIAISSSDKSRSSDLEVEDESAPENSNSLTNIYTIVPISSLFFLAVFGCFLFVRMDWNSKTVGYAPLESVEEI